LQLSLREQAELAGPAGELSLPYSCDARDERGKIRLDKSQYRGRDGRPADGPIYKIFEVL